MAVRLSPIKVPKHLFFVEFELASSYQGFPVINLMMVKENKIEDFILNWYTTDWYLKIRK